MNWQTDVAAAWDAITGFSLMVVHGLFGWLHRPEAAILLAGLLFAAALACVVWFLAMRIRPAHLALRKAIAEINTIPDKISFGVSYPRVDATLSGIPILRRAWSQFQTRLVIARQNARQPVRYTGGGASDFSIRNLEISGLRLRLFRSWPYYFLAAGLLLAALFILSVFFVDTIFPVDGAPPRPDIVRMEFVLLPLISGALSWVVLAGAYWGSRNNLRESLDVLIRVLEERLEYDAASSGQALPAHESALQSEQIRILSRDISSSLRRVEVQLSDTLPKRIGDAMGPLTAAIELLGNRLSEANSEALRGIVGELTAGLHEHTVRETEALASMLAEARRSLENAATAIDESSAVMREGVISAGDHVRDEIAGASTQLNDGLTTAGNDLVSVLGGATKDITGAFGSLSTNINELGEVLEAVNIRMSQQGEAFASIVEWAQTAAKSMGEAANDLMRAAPAGAAPDPYVTENLSKAVREARTSMDELAEARRMLTRLAENLRQPATSLLAEDWAQYRELFAESDDALAEIFENFREGANSQRAGLDNAVNALGARLDDALRDIEAGAVRLEVAIAGLGAGNAQDGEDSNGPG